MKAIQTILKRVAHLWIAPDHFETAALSCDACCKRRHQDCIKLAACVCYAYNEKEHP